MDNPLIDRINKTFKNKKLTWCGNFLTVGDPDQELEKGVCYDFTFQIKEIKHMELELQRVSLESARKFLKVEVGVKGFTINVLTRLKTLIFDEG